MVFPSYLTLQLSYCERTREKRAVMIVSWKKFIKNEWTNETSSTASKTFWIQFGFDKSKNLFKTNLPK
jgi:hypothetical protein